MTDNVVMMDNELAEIQARHDEQVQPGKMVPLEITTFAQAIDDRGRLLNEVTRLRKGLYWAMNKLGDDALERGKAARD